MTTGLTYFAFDSNIRVCGIDWDGVTEHIHFKVFVIFLMIKWFFYFFVYTAVCKQMDDIIADDNLDVYDEYRVYHGASDWGCSQMTPPSVESQLLLLAKQMKHYTRKPVKPDELCEMAKIVLLMKQFQVNRLKEICEMVNQ